MAEELNLEKEILVVKYLMKSLLELRSYSKRKIPIYQFMHHLKGERRDIYNIQLLFMCCYVPLN